MPVSRELHGDKLPITRGNPASNVRIDTRIRKYPFEVCQFDFIPSTLWIIDFRNNALYNWRKETKFVALLTDEQKAKLKGGKKKKN